MKTLAILLLAVLLLNINLKGENRTENLTSRGQLKQTVAYSVTPQGITGSNANDMIAELERKDVSRIAFRNTIQQASQIAGNADLSDLNNANRVAFRLNVKEVIEKINMNQMLYELAVAEVAFRLNIHDVMKNLANTDPQALENDTQVIRFALNTVQVEKYAQTVDINELVIEEPTYAESK